MSHFVITTEWIRTQDSGYVSLGLEPGIKDSGLNTQILGPRT